MPVTTRLLQRLHDSLGNEATNDLFAWWEEAATVNRAAVREVAELYFARFDARLEKGLAEVRAEAAKESGQLRAEIAEVRSEMAAKHADLLKWMFIFWIGTLAPLAGLIVALTKL